MTPARYRLDRYDEHGQDTWTVPGEESFAAEMGQPSTEPNPAHEPFEQPPVAQPPRPAATVSGSDPKWGTAQQREKVGPKAHYPAVLCQTPVTCQKCGRQAIPFEDVIVCVDGGWFHDECAESYVLDGSTDH